MIEVRIGNRIIGNKNPCMISFEPGATYANLEDAMNMIQVSAMAGADAIKFQTLVTGDADRLMGVKDIKVDFTTSTGKKQELVYDALKRRELSKDDWRSLVKFANEKNIAFITTPEFAESVDFLMELKVDALKISKGDINNVLLIEKAAKSNIPIILDGREKFSDVEIAINICKENKNQQIVIMHCPSGYPAENAGIHLNALVEIQKKFDYPVGFADHSPGDSMNYAAIALGVSMLEKTITTDKNIEQVEHFMSLELDELKSFVEKVRGIEKAMGTADILYKSRVEESARRSLVAKNLILKGEKISRENLDYKRPGNMGISVSEGFNVLNKVTKEDIPEGTFLQWDMLE